MSADKKMPEERLLSKKAIQEAFDLAHDILDDEVGELSESPHDYQCFTFVGPGISLVFYPHRTSAGNYHIRVRDQRSGNVEKAIYLMKLLNEKAGSNCTFSHKR